MLVFLYVSLKIVVFRDGYSCDNDLLFYIDKKNSIENISTKLNNDKCTLMELLLERF